MVIINIDFEPYLYSWDMECVQVWICEVFQCLTSWGLFCLHQQILSKN